MTPARRVGALGLGVLAALAWTLAADISFERGLQPVRPLYDGTTPPPPYRWVNPPEAFAPDNKPPAVTTKTFDLSGERSPSQAVSSEDTQASIVFADGGFVVPKGATGVEVTITPFDTTGLPDPQKPNLLEGNAYRFDAVYLPSREPLRFTSPCPEVTSCGTVILRWAVAGTKLYRLADDTVVEVVGAQHLAAPSFQIYGNIELLGTYIAGGQPPEGPRDDGFANALALGLGIATVVGAVVVSRFLPSRRSAGGKAAAGKKGKGKQTGKGKKGAQPTRADRAKKRGRGPGSTPKGS